MSKRTALPWTAPGDRTASARASMRACSGPSWRWKFFIEHGKPMPLQAYELLRQQTWQYVENCDAYFAEMRRNYFFIDRFPENTNRFPITLKDCLREEY